MSEFSIKHGREKWRARASGGPKDLDKHLALLRMVLGDDQEAARKVAIHSGALTRCSGRIPCVALSSLVKILQCTQLLYGNFSYARAAQVRFRVERFDPQNGHQPLNPFYGSPPV